MVINIVLDIFLLIATVMYDVMLATCSIQCINNRIFNNLKRYLIEFFILFRTCKHFYILLKDKRTLPYGVETLKNVCKRVPTTKYCSR